MNLLYKLITFLFYPSYSDTCFALPLEEILICCSTSCLYAVPYDSTNDESFMHARNHFFVFYRNLTAFFSFFLYNSRTWQKRLFSVNTLHNDVIYRNILTTTESLGFLKDFLKKTNKKKQNNTKKNR